MHDRVITRGEDPYADFGVMMLYGIRVQKALRLRSWTPQSDGTYQAVEIPGPSVFLAWQACPRVIGAILYRFR